MTGACHRGGSCKRLQRGRAMRHDPTRTHTCVEWPVPAAPADCCDGLAGVSQCKASRFACCRLNCEMLATQLRYTFSRVPVVHHSCHHLCASVTSSGGEGLVPTRIAHTSPQLASTKLLRFSMVSPSCENATAFRSFVIVVALIVSKDVEEWIRSCSKPPNIVQYCLILGNIGQVSTASTPIFEEYCAILISESSSLCAAQSCSR